MTEIKHNLRVLIALWEVEHGESLPLNRLADQADVNISTLARYANGKSGRVDLGVCAKLLDFFNGDTGYQQYSMGDLFKMERVPPLFWHIDQQRDLKLGIDAVFACDHCQEAIEATRAKLTLIDTRNLEHLLTQCHHCKLETKADIYHVFHVFVRNEP